MLVAISGGAGFLGLHLARRLVADGHLVRTLDLAPLDDAALEGSVDEVHGDVRMPADARRLVADADVLVHAAAALPIQVSRAAIRSVNVDIANAPRSPIARTSSARVTSGRSSGAGRPCASRVGTSAVEEGSVGGIPEG